MAKGTRTRTTRISNADDIATGGMAEVAIKTMLMAIDLGWEATELRGQVQLTREHEGAHQVIMLPTNQRSIKQAVSKSWMRKVIRYADPMKYAFVMGAIDDWTSDDPTHKARGEKSLDTLVSSKAMVEPEILREFVKVDPGLQGERDQQEAALLAEVQELTEIAEEAVRKATTPAAAGPEPGADEPKVSKIKPWVARHAMRPDGGEMYESRAVLERRWTDGTTDYICAFDGCDFVNVEARSVASHYGGKHGKDKPATQRREDMFVDPGISWTPSERQRGRISRLTKELMEASEHIPEDVHGEDAARALAEYIVKHRDEERDRLSQDETTPLSAEQVVERIRRMVDGGVYADLLARIDQVETATAARVEEVRTQLSSKERGFTNSIRAMESRLAEKDEEIAKARAAEAEALAREREAQERWTALQALING